MTECTTCKIQLSYPPTTVKPISTIGSNTGFYYITSGVPFNLSYIDGTDNTYLSGLASKAVLHKPLVNGTTATLTIVHKSNTGTVFYLIIPLIYTTTATNSLSNYLNSTSDTILELGNDIANKSINYYKDIQAFVVDAIEVNNECLDFKSKNGPVVLSGTHVTITKPTQLNDEVVCDYESDSTEDSAKSSEGDVGLTFAYIVPIILLSIFYMLMIHFNLKDIAWIGIIIGLIIGITGQALLLSKKNKSAYTGMTFGGWGFVALCCYFTFIYKPSTP
jgi:hypothetical protein